MTKEKWKAVKVVGLILALLIIPIILVLVNYILIGRDLEFIIYLILILSYLFAEFLLDMVFKFDFRSKLITHIPYILLEYAACFSFVFAVLNLDLILGWIISIIFWAFLVVLVYYIINQRKKKKEKMKD
ncbi:MAG: hypothetical protein P8Y70_05395 [Candidatus Lokiarchaeota archaeon]